MGFKVGQRVVYVGRWNGVHSRLNVPQKNEIVTIHGYEEEWGTWRISEYLKNKEGGIQAFLPKALKPLDHSFADSVLEKIKEDVLSCDS